MNQINLLKRISLLLVCALCILAFSGCVKDPSKDEPSGTSDPTSQTTSDPASQSPAQTEDSTHSTSSGSKAPGAEDAGEEDIF